ncbi:hypothetical protein chiPu_0019288 [Chiloscyllium punctatum]|uniref:Uncharacterized protein n=1 Tax=Chiloscyllium punctatum TaxID=137246 RepID=A0A401RRF6_CHIPU|nr:hypothetical protein [Chiloscyllium punctatum]
MNASRRHPQPVMRWEVTPPPSFSPPGSVCPLQSTAARPYPLTANSWSRNIYRPPNETGEEKTPFRHFRLTVITSL